MLRWIRFQHHLPEKPEHQPYEHAKPAYGAKIQCTKGAVELLKLNKEDRTFTQQAIGVFLFYGQAVDVTMLCPLSAIVMDQTNPTQETMEKVKKIMNHAATHPDTIVTYRKSDMILAGNIDVSYWSNRGARCQAGGHFFMSSDSPIPPNNRVVLTIAQLIKAVMTSSGRGWNRCTLHKCTRSSTSKEDPTRIGLPATTHSTPNRQHSNSPWSCE